MGLGNKAAAQKYMTVRQYGRAVAFAVQAGDAQRIARITESLIDEYVLHGMPFVNLSTYPARG